jgi:hypothetical protein
VTEIISHKDALARGLTYYFTGKACKRGHVADRWASTRGCVKCVRQSRMGDQPKPVDTVQPKASATRTRPPETRARYLERAFECKRLVGEAATPANRKVLLELAKKWRSAAHLPKAAQETGEE